MAEQNLRVAKKVAEEDSVQEILEWIRTKVARVDRKTKQAICPFAKKTLQTNKIHITKAKMDVLRHIVQCCDVIPIFDLDIVILYFDTAISEKRLSKICAEAHRQRQNYAVLYDHPHNKGLIKGTQFSFQKKPLVMIQNLNKLKNAQSKLRRTAYYRAWGLDPDSGMFY